MNRFARCAVSLAAASVSLLGGSLLAQAAPPGGGSTQTDMDRLKKEGYTCEVMSLGAYSCSKPGQPTQTCDSTGRCAVLKTTVRPGQPKQSAPPPPPIKGTSPR